ncbi:MAG: phosphoribosylanthranilate isomerase [Fimbriimonas sp.]
MTRVKICGLKRRQDAELAIEFGADALGFVMEPSSPRCIEEFDLKWIEKLPPFPTRVAVFGRVDRHVPREVFDAVQGVEWEVYGTGYPKRIHAVRLRPGQRAADIVQLTVNASALVLDAYKEGAYGGSGIKVDWDVAAEIVQRAEMRVILAGGLTPENVVEAIRRVRPYAVDVSSGVESENGVKDPHKLRAFIEAAKSV